MPFINKSRNARLEKPLRQAVQLAQPRRVQHRNRALEPTRPEHVGCISADRAWRTIRQLHHQQQRAVPPLKRPRRQHTPKQRMRLRDNPHFAWQDRTQLLQSVAFTVGVGKTHVAQALGHLAIRQGAEVRFTKTSRLLATLAGGHADRTWDKRLRELVRPALLILDDFGMRELTAAQADDLYELVAERTAVGGSMILTSNRSPVDWYPLFPNPVVAESLLDRLINTSHQVFLNGPSYRPNKRPGTNNQPKTPRKEAIG